MKKTSPAAMLADKIGGPVGKIMHPAYAASKPKPTSQPATNLISTKNDDNE